MYFNPRPAPLPLPAQRVVGVVVAACLLWLPLAPLRAEWGVLRDPAIADLSVDDLIAGAPILHPRIRLTGACIDHDQDVTARWFQKDKGARTRWTFESVALLRRETDGRSTGWFVHTPISTATGCEPVVLQGSLGALDAHTREAAQALGLSPDPERILAPDWITPPAAALRLLVGLWLGGSLAAFVAQAAGAPSRPSPTARRALRRIYLSIALSVVAWAVVWAGAACADG